MKIIKFGSGKNLFNIIVGVHGDEVAPIKGFFLLREYLKDKEVKNAFSVIIANEQAIKQKRRFVKTDLNRSFPGIRRKGHESALASKLLAVTQKSEYNFDFHSTNIEIRPYGVVSVYSKKVSKVMSATGIENYLFDNSESLIKFAPNSIAFEVGLEADPKSAVNAFKIMRNILIYFKIFKGGRNDFAHYNYKIFLIYHFILASKFCSMSRSLVDFKYVRKGSIIGYQMNRKPIIASEGFFPILIHDRNAIKKAKRIEFFE